MALDKSLVIKHIIEQLPAMFTNSDSSPIVPTIQLSGDNVALNAIIVAPGLGVIGNTVTANADIRAHVFNVFAQDVTFNQKISADKTLVFAFSRTGNAEGTLTLNGTLAGLSGAPVSHFLAGYNVIVNGPILLSNSFDRAEIQANSNVTFNATQPVAGALEIYGKTINLNCDIQFGSIHDYKSPGLAAFQPKGIPYLLSTPLILMEAEQIRGAGITIRGNANQDILLLSEGAAGQLRRFSIPPLAAIANLIANQGDDITAASLLANPPLTRADLAQRGIVIHFGDANGPNTRYASIDNVAAFATALNQLSQPLRTSNASDEEKLNSIMPNLTPAASSNTQIPANDDSSFSPVMAKLATQNAKALTILKDSGALQSLAESTAEFLLTQISKVGEFAQLAVDIKEFGRAFWHLSNGRSSQGVMELGDAAITLAAEVSITALLFSATPEIGLTVAAVAASKLIFAAKVAIPFAASYMYAYYLVTQ